jgi:hypothetical protein
MHAENPRIPRQQGQQPQVSPGLIIAVPATSMGNASDGDPDPRFSTHHTHAVQLLACDTSHRYYPCKSCPVVASTIYIQINK